MRNVVWMVVGLALVLGAAAAAQEKAPAQPEAPVVAAQGESAEFIQSLMTRMDSKNAKLRFAVREALVVMGPPAVSALNAHKASVEDPALKAFMDRTVARIKSMKSYGGRSFSSLRGRDLDQLAVQCNLTLEQITQVGPILAKHDKNVKELYQEFQEAGGYRDPEARKDLQEELNLLAEDAGPKLRKYLNDAQADTIAKQLKGRRSVTSFGGNVQIMGGPGGSSVIIRKPPSGGGGGGGGK